MPGQQYDTTLKLLLRNSATVAIRQLTGGMIETWLDSELPRVENQRADLVGRDQNSEYVHIELQSTPPPDLDIRMADYCIGIRRVLGHFPRQILVFVGRSEAALPAELRGPRFHCEWDVVQFRDLDGEPLLASPNVSDNVLAILARLRDHKGAVRSIVGRIAALEGAARLDALSQLLILAGLRKLEIDVLTEVKKMPVLIDILDNEVLGPPYRRGLDQGKEEGKAEGKLEGKLELLRRQIVARLGAIPEPVAQKLSAMTDSDLDVISLRILTAASFDDLFA